LFNVATEAVKLYDNLQTTAPRSYLHTKPLKTRLLSIP
jgi:hypothetical protein